MKYKKIYRYAEAANIILADIVVGVGYDIVMQKTKRNKQRPACTVQKLYAIVGIRY
jgi:hypothetical protein